MAKVTGGDTANSAPTRARVLSAFENFKPNDVIEAHPSVIEVLARYGVCDPVPESVAYAMEQEGAVPVLYNPAEALTAEALTAEALTAEALTAEGAE